MSWQREFDTSRLSGASTLLFAIFVGLVGFLVVSSGSIETVVPLALIGIAIYVMWAWYVGTDRKIVCDPSGFSITTSSRTKGTRRREYLWSEVIKTTWDAPPPPDDSIVSVQYFKVETLHGEAFNVSNVVSGFHDLIQLFNQMTPHLPYTWEEHGLGAWGYKQVTRCQGGIPEGCSTEPTDKGSDW